MRDRIYITEADFEKLRRLIEVGAPRRVATANISTSWSGNSTAPTLSKRKRSPMTS